MYFYSLSRPLALSTPLDDIYIRLPLVICGTTNAFELLFCAWYSFIAFGFNISSNDNLLPYEVAKVVLISSATRCLSASVIAAVPLPSKKPEMGYACENKCTKVKKEEKEQAANKAVRTIPAPPRPTAAKVASPQG